MNIRYLSLVVLLIMSLLAPAQAQTYDKMWKELEGLVEKDLPKSVVDKAMEIYTKAKAEQQVPQMMKAYLTAMQYRSVITPDAWETDLESLEQWAAQTERVEDKAVLCSILGEMLLLDDVRKGFGYLQASLEAKEQLLSVSAASLRPMVKTGETSRRYFRDNLYDLLARRAIQLMGQYRWKAGSVAYQTNRLPTSVNSMEAFMAWQIVPASDCDFPAAVMQTYQSLLKAYDNEEDRAAWLLTGVEVLDDLPYSSSAAFRQQELRRWIQVYGAVETIPEVYLALAQLEDSDHQVERLRLIREGIARHPHYEGINRLKNVEKEILNPALSLSVDPAYPGREQQVHVGYKNLSGITLQLYKVNLPVTSAVLQNRGKNFLSKHASLLREEHFALTPTPDYLNTDTTLTMQAPQAGIYLLRVMPDGKKDVSDEKLMYVTSLKTIHRPLPDGTLEVVVVDAVSGQPVPEAQVTVYTEKGGGYSPQQTYQADGQGTLKLELVNERAAWCQAHTMADRTMPVFRIWRANYVYTEDKRREVLRLFTDRSLYRPGQTVYVSGMAYEQEKETVRVLANRAYTVSLYDVNQNEIGKVEVKTNDFGSFSGQFALPSPCLTGRFSLRAGRVSVGFRVEEYKRPTFDVSFDPVTVGYQAGDSIRLAGVAKTFAGAAVQHARVSYRITRSDFGLWRRGGQHSDHWDGETATDAEGKFSIPVRLETDVDRKETPLWYYTYSIQAEVTDGAGETQQADWLLPLGSTSMTLSVDNLPDNLVKEKQVKMTPTAINLLRKPVDVQIAYRVVGMEDKKEGKQVLAGTWQANTEVVPEEIYALPSGNYRLKLSAKDAQGRECTASQDFLLFSLNDRRPPVQTADWFYQDGKEFDAASPVTIYIGSSEQDVYLLYDVFAGNKRLESKRIVLSDSVLAFRFPYKEEYGDGICVSLAFVKDGALYSHNTHITKPLPDKQLQLKWTTFRDKLRPGQQEEWRLTVLRPDGQPADAELMATLYDASLDKLYREHGWSFGLTVYRAVPSTYWNLSHSNSVYLSVNFPWKMLDVPSWAYSSLVLPYPERLEMYGPRMLRTRMLSTHAMSNEVRLAAQENSLAMDVEYQAYKTMSDAVMEAGIEPAAGQSRALESLGEVELRENFAETAFFYPQLRTNAEGEVSLSFVLPESLTRWKFMGLAHTKDVDYGTIEATATATKEFMVQPNMPRFVRVGDKVNIASSLVNLSEKDVKGTIRMELFNPETEKVFYSQKQKFAVKAGETGQVSFAFEVNDRYAVMACRIVAEGDTFSDGEQRYIPVLTDKQWVTETVPLHVNGKGTHTFSLENLFNRHSRTASGQRLTVEFTANPAWYAVQALPVVAHPQHEDALSWATAYYANSLAAFIVKANPRIKQVFDSWKAQGGTKETLMSNLQKNPELKNILLAETPWLAEATSEAEQKQRIATLFDLNTMNSSLAVSVDKLAALQQADGSWSWYKGMAGNRTVTTQVMEMLARLQALTGTAMDSRVQRMYQNGLAYLGKQAEEEYQSMTEAGQKGTAGLRPSEQVLRYLYICALDGKAPADKKIHTYFIDKLAGMGKELTIYGKALGAIILQEAGRSQEAGQLMQSLMEYAVTTEEMGCYFDTPKALYSWCSYKIPTEVAAMEAIQRTTKDAKVLDDMKRWLLKQKQTQAWETPIATADAIYALMSTGTDWLQHTGEVKITLGKETIQTPADDAVGYIKQTVTGEVMNIKTVTVDKKGDGMGWGAVYAQYLESMDQIGGQGNSLSITRRLYRGDEALPESAPLKVGDKLTVRLTVTADRDMDFVQIKDSRAACMEPLQQSSGYRWGENLGYYQVTKDASTQFFIDRMRKGTHVIAYEVYVDRAGKYQAGIATVQSAYAPEFGGHTAGYEVKVE